MNVTKWALAGVAVLIVGGGVLFAGPALADGNRGERRAQYEQMLAQELGISVDQLKDAQLDARNAVIDQALANGAITAEQAEKMKNTAPGELRRHAGKAIRHAAADVFAAAAKTIGISTDELKQQLSQGQSLAGVAANHNVSRDQLKAGIMTEVNAQLQTAVANSNLTQEQADKLADGVSQRLDSVIDRTRPGKP
jgi:membrane peptidoglycan carboxypeptidase